MNCIRSVFRTHARTAANAFQETAVCSPVTVNRPTQAPFVSRTSRVSVIPASMVETAERLVYNRPRAER